MKRTQKIGLGLVLFHLIMVAMGAFEVEVPEKWTFGLYQLYGKVTGASSGYGFFAPGVGSQLRATFEVYDAKGALVATVPLEKGENREADLRVGNIVGWFWKDNPERKTQRSMVASWAGKIFGRYPNAQEVVVVLDEYHMPTMEGYRKGTKPHWVKYYKAKFVRKGAES